MHDHRRLTLPLASVIAFAACGKDPEPEPACADEKGIICTWAGDGEAAFDGDGHALLQSSFYWPIDLTFGAGDTAYVVDWNNHRVRKLEADGTLKTVIGTDFVGDGPDKNGADLMAPGVPGTEIHLNHPTQLLPLADGKLILVSWHNHKLRTYDPVTGLAVVTCGRAAGFAGDGGPVKDALFDQPIGLAHAPDGSMFLLDQRNQVIRKIGTDGIITTVAGTPKNPGFDGDGGPPLQAKMSQPAGSNPPPGGGIAVASDGRLYFSDLVNNRIRRVDLGADRIETVAGTGTAGFDGDGGAAASAKINNPRKLTFGPDGRLYFADELNHRIRAIDVATGVVTTVAGNGSAAFSGDGGAPAEASLNRPAGVTFHGEHMYILDTYNHRIRRVRL